MKRFPILDWLFPPRCALCRRPLEGDRQGLCPDCRKSRETLTESWAKTKAPFLEGCVSVYLYEGDVRRGIHAFKYRGAVGSGRVFGELLAQRLAQSGLAPRVQAVCWVPCHWKTKRRRGYEQAAEIARPMAKQLDLPAMALLKKTRDTKPMNKLGAAARRANVLGAFAADCPPGALEGLSILIVDDVYTTGATLSECARALREAGAAHVYGATFAKAGVRRKQKDERKTP